MHVILTLVRKDIATFVRNRAAMILTFLVPIALIYIFGWVFGLHRSDSGPTGIRIAVINASSNPAAEKLVDALRKEKAFRVVTTFDLPDKKQRPLAEDDVRPMIRNGTFRFALVLPEDLIRTGGLGLHLKILSDPRNEVEAQMVNGLLQKTIFSNVPELLGQSLQARAREALGDERMSRFNRGIADTVAGAFGRDPEEMLHTIESGSFGIDRLTSRSATSAASTDGKTASAEDVFSRIVKIEQEQVVGKDVKSPVATRLVGGWAVMFLLFAVSGSSAAFFDEANAGLFQRLLSAPVTRAQLLWSRFLHGVILGLVQLAMLFAAGRMLYGIDVFGHFGNLVLVCAFVAGACTSVGMLIAALAPNAPAASGLATFLVMVMSATGGAWFPLSMMPEFMQQIGKFSVVYWSMEGFARVLWAGNEFSQVLPVLGVLGGMTAGLMAIAVWRLNRKQIFA